MAKTKADLAAPPFAGFSAKAAAFFDGLAANNDREWFQARKPLYEAEVKAPMGALVEAAAFAFMAHDIPLTGTAKQSLFRINRDVRFSKNKNPYKTNAGAVLSRDGTKTGRGVFYFQIGQTGAAFMAMGFYGPEPEELALMRQAIVRAPESWLKIVARLEAAGLTLSREEALVRTPKGFEAHADEEYVDALKLKNFVVRRPVADGDLQDPELVRRILAFAQLGLPLLEFVWSALAWRE
jgi:uncharacterized protein (TIGR02453 family)